MNYFCRIFLIFRHLSLIAMVGTSGLFACESEEKFIGSVFNNDLEAVNICIRKYDVNLRYSNRMTPLMIAANNHYKEMTGLLIDRGADPNLRFSSAEQFFEGAGQAVHGAIVAAVASFLQVERTSKVISLLSLGLVNQIALEDAMKNYTTDQLIKFVDAFKAFIPLPDQVSSIVTLYGIQKGAVLSASVYAFQGLLAMYEASKASRSNSYAYSFTPLMHSVVSVRNQDIEMLDILITRGSDPDTITDQCGENALMLAIRSTARESKLSVVEYLLKHTRDINLKNRGYVMSRVFGCTYDYCDVTALHMAALHAQPEVVEVLLRTKEINAEATSSMLCGGLQPTDMSIPHAKSLELIKEAKRSSMLRSHDES